MSFPQGWRKISEDRIAVRYYNPKTRQVVSKGKRVGKDCKLTTAERRAYVEVGAARTVRFIMDRLSLGIKDAYDLLKTERA